MDFKGLKEKQRKLDSYIGESKNIDMSKHVLDRNKALQVEFNEFINEVPELFKYWSNKKMKRDAALEEFVDGIHFLISLSNDLGVEDYTYTEPFNKDIESIVLRINYKISTLLWTKDFKSLMDDYMFLGYYLGFTDEDIEQFYEQKNQENYNRQNNGY